jgi:2-oxo-4-hydroxy-4-carboxy-5-ureidoimidazoline decarboxylase
MSAIERLNSLPVEVAKGDLERCCGSTAWVDRVVAARPFLTMEELLEVAEREWFALGEKDWLEAFSHHPKIGEGGVEALRKKFASTATWASNEQAGVSAASDEVLHALARGNERYAEKFGFIFIVCATGKSAREMLGLLEARLPNDRATELKNAAGEQAKITALRLKKLAASVPSSLI